MLQKFIGFLAVLTGIIIILTALQNIYTPQKVIISFICNECGDEVENLEGDLNTAIENIPEPLREGYVFSGWFDVETDRLFNEETFIQGRQVYAKWEIASYTLTFDTDGGSIIPPRMQEYASTIVIPNDPIKEGYTFNGWDATIPSTMPAEDLTFKAQWTINQYTITFNTDGGSSITAITQDYNTAISAPDDPTKDGYTFNGWDNTIPATIPAEDLVFTATWTANSYNVTFDSNTGSGTMTAQAITYDNSAALTTNTFIKTGYTFSGWNTASDGSGTAYNDDASFTMSVEGITLYAQWTINQYTITFNTDGGTTITAITQDYQSAFTAPSNPSKIGYTFNGWNNEVPTIIPAEDIILTAIWTINQYTLTFDTDGGSSITAITQDYQSAVTAPSNPTKVGYTFNGWDATIPSTMPAEDLTFTAQWTINQYTITFNTDGGTTITAITQDYQSAFTAPSNPSKIGYTFNGWNNEVPTIIPAEDIILTAIWTINQYTLTFDTDGGSSITAITQDYNTAVTSPSNPTKEGYTFDGWNVSLPTTMPAENITVTALWTEVNSYDLIFKNDDDTIISSSSFIAGADLSTASIPEDPTKLGYTFDGWDTSIPTEMPNNDIIIQATYSINEYTITFDVTGGSSITAITQDYNTAISAPDDPTKDGYTFNGWDNTIPATIPAEDLVFTATWTANSYNVTFDSNTGSGTMSAQAITYDSSAALTTNTFIKTGYTFSGWNTESDGSGTAYNDDASFTMSVEGITLYAQWLANNIHNLVFKDDDGTTIRSTQHTEGDDLSAVTYPSNPSKTGYNFNSWDSVIPATMPNTDVIITATYTINSYTITFDSQGGTSVSSITQNYNTAVSAPTAPTRTNYIFTEWYTELAYTTIYSFTTMPANNITLYARWTPTLSEIQTIINNASFSNITLCDGTERGAIYDAVIALFGNDPFIDVTAIVDNGNGTFNITVQQSHPSINSTVNITNVTVSFNACANYVATVIQEVENEIAQLIPSGLFRSIYVPNLSSNSKIAGIERRIQQLIDKYGLTVTYVLDNSVLDTPGDPNTDTTGMTGTAEGVILTITFTYNGQSSSNTVEVAASFVQNNGTDPYVIPDEFSPF